MLQLVSFNRDTEALRWTDGARAGVKAEGPIASRATHISLDEARQILGVEKNATLEEVSKVSSALLPSQPL